MSNQTLLTSLVAPTVLIIEDSADDVLLLSILLEEVPGTSFRLVHASRLEDGLKLALSERPEVILLDLNLPDGHGMDAVTRVRLALPSVPLVVLTGSDDEDLAMRVVRAGAQDYLVKGRVDSWILARTLRHSLERHRLMEELEEAHRREAHRATHDALTGLPNRTLFLDRLSHGLARAERRRERLAVLYLDLDGFKPVNDTLGHAAGDQILIRVARHLDNGVRRSDTLARLGGDEFGVLFERVPDRTMAESLVQGLRALLRDPVSIDGKSFQMGFSAGLALYPEDGRNADTLLRMADAAMYRDKESRRAPRESRQLKVV